MRATLVVRGVISQFACSRYPLIWDPLPHTKILTVRSHPHSAATANYFHDDRVERPGAHVSRTNEAAGRKEYAALNFLHR